MPRHVVRLLGLAGFGRGLRLPRPLPLRSFAEDHLAQLPDGRISPLQQFDQHQDGSQQSLDLRLGPGIQIRRSDLLDQILDFSWTRSRYLFHVGHSRSLTFSLGI
jgi:hypothetical protein